jgi:hypothetical protein
MVEDPYAQERAAIMAAAETLIQSVTKHFEPRITQAHSRGQVHRVAELYRDMQSELDYVKQPFVDQLSMLPSPPMILPANVFNPPAATSCQPRSG